MSLVQSRRWDSNEACDGEGPLTLELVQKHLTNLGHNGYGEITFTNLSLVNKGLTSIEPLWDFAFLQDISLDGNRLTSLQPLESLHSLVYLSVRDNELTGEGLFPCLHNSSSSLERLFADGNRLTSLAGLSRLVYLRDLTLSRNTLTELRAEDFLPLKALTRFVAADNAIASVDPGVFSGSRQVRSVDLCHNKISHLAFLAYITAQLETLLLSHNNITSLGPTLSDCHSLVVLDISFNAIADMRELRVLQPASLLRQIILAGNPFWISEDDDGEEDAESGGEVVKSKKRDPSIVGATAAVSAERGSGVRTDEEVVVKDAADLVAAASSRKNGEPEQHYLKPQGITSNSAKLDHAALTVPNTYGVVRHVLTASRMAVIPWDLDRAIELRKLPASRQVFLQLIYMLPWLEGVDDEEVVPQDVARAKFFFGDVNSLP